MKDVDIGFNVAICTTHIHLYVPLRRLGIDE